jgi:hypothetical protein
MIERPVTRAKNPKARVITPPIAKTKVREVPNRLETIYRQPISDRA